MYWINLLFENVMFTQPVASILYCYGVYQDFYNKMHDNPSIYKGLSSQEDIDNFVEWRISHYHIG